MPNLPETRVKRSKPFEQIGLDYMGPITIKHNNEKFKRWIALFTCFTTRAIHLELVENLSAESFMYVLRRFISRRGCPKLVLSDNASQFQPVFKIMMEQNGNFLASKGIVWKNIVPKAPWSGGVCERMIGLTKKALRRAIGRKLLWERELITLTTEIEGILNTRPLTYLNFDDYKIIRPIDFISPNVPSSVSSNHDCDQEEFILYTPNIRDKLINYWPNTFKTLDVFWENWKNEYLISLRERTQRELASPRLVDKRIPRAGEIVLLNEPELPEAGGN
uniref:Integrase catalytic domain-containing protein n=1 Tax=Loa loa TaxID=7209 RepID=A0A1I7VZ55_LOALO